MPDPTPTPSHVCDADCWAYIIRYGVPEGCDPFTARDAADAQEERS